MNYPFTSLPSDNKFIYFDRELTDLFDSVKKSYNVVKRIRDRQQSASKAVEINTSLFRYSEILRDRKLHPERYFSFDCFSTRFCIRYNKSDSKYFCLADGWNPSSDTLALLDELPGSLVKSKDFDCFKTFLIGYYEDLGEAVITWCNLVYYFFRDFDFDFVKVYEASK